MPNIGIWELVVILILALVIFGPGKLPDVGKALGKAMREFRQAAREVKAELDTEETSADPAQPQPRPEDDRGES